MFDGAAGSAFFAVLLFVLFLVSQESIWLKLLASTELVA